MRTKALPFRPDINTVTAQDPAYNMQVLDRREAKYLLGVLGLGALLYGFYRLYRAHSRPASRKASRDEETREEPTSQDDNSQHIPYDEPIEDLNCADLPPGLIAQLKHIRDIQYRVILCVMKGNCYQGVVNLAFTLDRLPQDNLFSLAYHGTNVKFVKVNGSKLEPREVKYSAHKIIIPGAYLKEKTKNTVEVIFENNYSFMDNGLASYFPIDDNNKYSLRQQLIYSLPNWNAAPNFIPCLNCSNPCSVHLEAIHPENFEAFANSTKALVRTCSVTEYPRYPFLFDHTNNPVSRSIKLNASTLSVASSDNMSQRSNISSSTYYGRKRANTHFHPTRLPSIHHLFLLCSEMAQLPLASSPLDSEVLVRYFCKYAQSHLFLTATKPINNYLQEILRRLSQQQIKHKIVKIDVFIIADPEAEGTFAPGILLLHEDAVKELATDSRCYYLIARALCGMLRIANGQNVLTLADILELNYQVFLWFQELRGYIYLKNKEYQHIRNALDELTDNDFFTKNEGHFLQYYSKELKYFIKRQISDKVQFELCNVVASISKDKPEQFWKNMLSNFNFLPQLIIDPLVAYGLSTIGPPKDNLKLLEQLKICFNSSKYALSFYTDKQISENLPKFIECEAYGLQDRLPTLKVLSKFKDFITQQYHNYLPVKSNVAEAQVFYNQFKKFNEKKNFHHLSTLRNQVNRVNIFGSNFIKPERVSIQCSLPAWKLLKQIKIYPSDRNRFALLKSFDNIEF